MVTSPDRCQSLPTITNLLADDCPRIPGGLSDIDLGYLRGLYHMNPEHSRRCADRMKLPIRCSSN